MNGPTELELKNTDKVLGLMADMDQLSFKNIEGRADIFEVSGPNGSSCVMDVEETVVCLSSEVCDLPEDVWKKIPVLELLMNKNYEAVHGKFAIHDGKVYFKENLEVENLDGNELESALAWTLAMVNSVVSEIAEII